MFVPPSVTPKAFEQLAVIGASKEGKALRVAVEGGGCSGFQYEMAPFASRPQDTRGRLYPEVECFSQLFSAGSRQDHSFQCVSPFETQDAGFSGT